MSDYTQITDFSAKDLLSTGDAEKLILGADFDAEFDAISTAIATKYDSTNLATQAQAEALTLDTVLITPHSLNDVLADNAGFLQDLQALSAYAQDRVFMFDLTDSQMKGFTLGNGITTSGTTLLADDANIDHDALSNFVANEHIDHSAVSITAGNGLTGGGTIAANRTIDVVGGNGITANANDVAISDASVSATVPVGFSAGALTWDSSSITEIIAQNLSQGSDGFLISDSGTLKQMKYDECGVLVATVSGTSDALGQSDMNKFIEYTSGSAVSVTLASSIGDIGNFVIIKQTGAGQVTVSGTATLEYATGAKTRAQHSVIILVCIASGVWALYGDAAA